MDGGGGAGRGINTGPGPEENHLLIFFNLESIEDVGFQITTSAFWLIVSGRFSLLCCVCRLIITFLLSLYSPCHYSAV